MFADLNVDSDLATVLGTPNSRRSFVPRIPKLLLNFNINCTRIQSKSLFNDINMFAGQKLIFLLVATILSLQSSC